ncbi:MAG: peptide deformylase [Legionella sp.]
MALDIVSIEQEQYVQVLKSQAHNVTFPLNEADKNLIEAMKSKLYALGGVGLAAPQVNQPKKIIAVYIPEEASLLRDNVREYPMHIMINPTYEPVVSEGTYTDYESCYSVSSKAGKVPRYKSIKVSYYDESGMFHQQMEQGFYARVLQHEIDHIQGILIIDRLTHDCVQGTIEEIMALRRAELSEEKRAVFDRVLEKKAGK